MTLQVIDKINDILPSDWQRLNVSRSPFLDYEYFLALEASGSIGDDTGWTPHHVMFEEAGELNGLLPSYVKSHSWGEFVFDWDWAQAFEQHGFNYYPKLVSTIPFTPIASDKLLAKAFESKDMVDQMIEHCQTQSLNSWHLLFCPPMTAARDDVFERYTVQFHWFNRDYRDFEHFLSGFMARKRKNVRKERLSITAQGIEVRRLKASDIGQVELDFFYLCYQQSYFKRNHTPHLSKSFFAQIFATLADNILLLIACHEKRYVASALFLFDDSALFGRYWGCVEEFNFLHFELCYYQGIEFCIEHNLQSFNPGAQGEHKIKRGFEPVFTYSYHWIREPRFQVPIANYCRQERRHYQQYFQQCQQQLPFKASYSVFLASPK